MEKPKKRQKNTSAEQYELYITTMESDYIFRSGVINPTVDPKYIENKWTSLTTQLNCTGTGPVLPKEIWKKRFKDWKNATRSKYRKIRENRIITGGGVGEKDNLTPLEERGLSVWGKVTVTGTPLIKKTGGLICSPHSPILAEKEIEPLIQEESDGDENVEEIFIHINEMDMEQTLEEPCDSTNYQKENKMLKETPKKGTKLNRKSDLVQAANDLKNVYSENVKVLESISTHMSKFGKIYQEVQAKRNQIKERKLNFSIAKYKYENENFEFS